MISADDAAALLRPLAQPTLDAFAEARRDHDDVDRLVGQRRDKLAHAPRALLVGIEDWCAISHALARRYEPVQGVKRDTDGHVLSYTWTVAGRVRLQLKSDAYALDVVQPPLPGMEETEGIGVSTVVLSWGPEASRPVFILRDGKQTVWQMTAESLLVAEPASAITPSMPKARLTSKQRPVADDGEAATGASD